MGWRLALVITGAAFIAWAFLATVSGSAAALGNAGRVPAAAIGALLILLAAILPRMRSLKVGLLELQLDPEAKPPELSVSEVSVDVDDMGRTRAAAIRMGEPEGRKGLDEPRPHSPTAVSA
jgi:hypothetical protein